MWVFGSDNGTHECGNGSGACNGCRCCCGFGNTGGRGRDSDTECNDLSNKRRHSGKHDGSRARTDDYRQHPRRRASAQGERHRALPAPCR